MDSDKRSAQVERLEVVDTGRRRRWSEDEKLKIVLGACKRPVRSRRQRGVVPGCPLSIAIASFCSSLKKRRAGVLGARGASFEGAVKLLSAADWLALVPTTGRAEG